MSFGPPISLVRGSQPRSNQRTPVKSALQSTWIVPLLVGGLVWFWNPFPMLAWFGLTAIVLGVVAGGLTWNLTRK